MFNLTTGIAVAVVVSSLIGGGAGILAGVAAYGVAAVLTGRNAQAEDDRYYR